jgi:hypothetical protein
MPSADNTIEVDQFMLVKNVCKIYEQFMRFIRTLYCKEIVKTYVFRHSISDRKLEGLGFYKLFAREDNRCTH